MDRWRPLSDELRAGAASLGSVMFPGDEPRDPNGLPCQVVCRSDGDERVVGLVLDETGGPLAWVLSEDGTTDIQDEAGRPALRPVPPEVAAEAWAWLADRQ